MFFFVELKKVNLKDIGCLQVISHDIYIFYPDSSHETTPDITKYCLSVNIYSLVTIRFIVR